MKPGERITETTLAEQLGIARGTLRTGLNRLTIEGIVLQTPYVGWQVANLTADDIWEIWTLRASLEQLAAILVARKGDTKTLQVIETAFLALQKACDKGSRKAIDRCEIALRQAIVVGSGHRRLIRQYALVQQQVRWVKNTTGLMHAPNEAILEQHQTLVRSITCGSQSPVTILEVGTWIPDMPTVEANQVLITQQKLRGG